MILFGSRQASFRFSCKRRVLPLGRRGHCVIDRWHLSAILASRYSYPESPTQPIHRKINSHGQSLAANRSTYLSNVQMAPDLLHTGVDFLHRGLLARSGWENQIETPASEQRKKPRKRHARASACTRIQRILLRLWNPGAPKRRYPRRLRGQM